MNNFSTKGNIVDIRRQKIFSGEIIVEGNRIKSVHEHSTEGDKDLPFILPGFIDSHVHIESSMLVPAEFAKLAVIHGTVATVSDPHEIANVCGLPGVQFMIDNASTVNFKFYFGAPSCVPATTFETAGDEINASGIAALLTKKEIRYLSEMMNFPGVINEDAEVMKKIGVAHTASKPIDGHAPGLRGELLRKYIQAGISTDHECFTKEEALEKLSLGMKILIREGSAAKNFEALIDLLNDHPDMMMFCSDDKHPDSLVKNHINELCRRAVKKGIPIFNILKAACINPVIHYKLDSGILREDDLADFIIVKDLENFEIIKTFINGVCVAENGRSNIKPAISKLINKFNCGPVKKDSLTCNAENHLIQNKLPVIEAYDGQLITGKLMTDPVIKYEEIISDVDHDILKLVVVNRYSDAPPAVSFIKNFGFKKGAIASSVAHDSHNIIAVGVDDESIAAAINMIIEKKGGVSCVSGEDKKILSLPVAGLMSSEDGFKVAAEYTEIDKMAKSLGSALSAPFMTLSFMALLVIPSLKLSDKGLFDGVEFRFV
jgi:adenine deaminase